MGKSIQPLQRSEDLDLFKSKLGQAQLIIDAIFGIGLSGEVKEPYKSVIQLMNNSVAKKPILSVDVPSGLDATEGRALGTCIKATKTVTFALPKTGLIKNEGPLYAGEVLTADISIPKKLLLSLFKTSRSE